MRRGFKPYNKRKPFSRKKGGGKFMLNGGRYRAVSFSAASLDKNVFAGMSNLISLILGQKKVQSNTRVGDR